MWMIASYRAPSSHDKPFLVCEGAYPDSERTELYIYSHIKVKTNLRRIKVCNVVK